MFAGAPLLLRPIRPEDEPAYRSFLDTLATEELRLSLFDRCGEPAHSELARLTQIDYEREMAFVAARGAGGTPEMLGVARLATDPDNVTAEFFIAVQPACQRQGLGSILLEKLLNYCKRRGTTQIVGHVLHTNDRMLSLAEKHGFRMAPRTSDDVIDVHLPLTNRPSDRHTS